MILLEGSEIVDSLNRSQIRWTVSAGSENWQTSLYPVYKEFDMYYFRSLHVYGNFMCITYLFGYKMVYLTLLNDPKYLEQSYERGANSFLSEFNLLKRGDKIYLAEFIFSESVSVQPKVYGYTCMFF